jgi:hypothetical protein
MITPLNFQTSNDTHGLLRMCKTMSALKNGSLPVQDPGNEILKTKSRKQNHGFVLRSACDVKPPVGPLI